MPVARDLAAVPVVSAVSVDRDSVAVSAAEAALATVVSVALAVAVLAAEPVAVAAASILMEIPAMGIRNIIIPATIWMTFLTVSSAAAEKAAAVPKMAKMCLLR